MRDAVEEATWSMLLFAWLLVAVMVFAGCAQPTRVKVQQVADRALDEELHRGEQCRLLTTAARIARMQHSPFAPILAADAFRICHPGSEPPVWP